MVRSGKTRPKNHRTTFFQDWDRYSRANRRKLQLAVKELKCFIQFCKVTIFLMFYSPLSTPKMQRVATRAIVRAIKKLFILINFSKKLFSRKTNSGPKNAMRKVECSPSSYIQSLQSLPSRYLYFTLSFNLSSLIANDNKYVRVIFFTLFSEIKQNLHTYNLDYWWTLFSYKTCISSKKNQSIWNNVDV